jgi:carbonic anhydrase
MFRHAPWLWIALISALSGGCDKVRAVVCEPVKAAANGGNAGAAGSKAEPGKLANEEAAAGNAASVEAEPTNEEPARKSGSELLTSTTKFALPFAWEKSPSEPLARAKIFLRELADDNAAYAKRGADFDKAFGSAETPRATVLTCSDSRVQPGAYDATPENDEYTIRNLGNQFENGLGSVQYGVEQLHTPVLLVLGHTGCTAVKAALSGASDLPEPVRHELASLHLKKGKVDEKRWTAAVLENVHDQVRAALKQFGGRVNAGELTIIGAVYDLRNELGQGPGKLQVINVNGNQDPDRLKAFGEAIMSTPNPNGRGVARAKENPLDRLARALATNASDGDDEDEDEDEPVTMGGTIKPAAPGKAVPASQAAPHKR